MTRPDANSIALRATRNILAAAHDFSFELAGAPITVTCTRQPVPKWPRVLQGLDEAADGPWPTPVTIEASWEGGSSRLVALCDYWRRTDEWAHAVGMRVGIAETRRELLWVTLMFFFAEATDGQSVPMRASVAMLRAHEDEDAPTFIAQNAALRKIVTATKIPMLTPAQAQLCSVAVPTGDITPDPATAFERAVIIGVAKHAWFERRDRVGFTGTPFVDVPFLKAGLNVGPAADVADAVKPVAGKRAGIWPLPGGVRAYVTTLLTLLQDIDQREPLPVASLTKLFEERYQVIGEAAIRGYLAVLKASGFIAQEDGEVALTDEGRAWLGSPEPALLFECLHREFIGFLELLVLAELAPTLPTSRVRSALCAVLGTDWKTDNQVSFRRNWLLSMGLTDRTAKGDAITVAGTAVLARHLDEAEDVRFALREALVPHDIRAQDEPEAEADDLEVDAFVAPDVSASKPADALWAHLDLSAQTLGSHLGKLCVDPRLLDQLASAVSAGKHILFVGPPGTGKTELAVALTKAAAAEGYCAGLFTATASADWTTFDTIGGYAMQQDQTLAFRPGAFLRAILEQKWLLVDELNRADVDRAFGELMTVLAGQGTDTHYELGDGRRVSIGAEEHRTFRVPPSFRVLATMNTWDKTSLFRLSYAVQRRFAIINVGLPDDTIYAGILAAASEDGALLPKLDPTHLPVVQRLFSRAGLLSLRDIGPAVALDVVRYLRRRGPHGDGIAEAIEMFVLPQLQGLNENTAKNALKRCEEALGAAASAPARASLRARFQELFPGLGAADD